MQKVFLAIPSHTGEIRASTAHALACTTAEAVRRGIELVMQIWEGDSLISNARNIQMASFRVSDCTDMVFLDTDIRFEPHDFFRLISHKADVVGGAYRYKQDNREGYPLLWLPDPDGKGLWSYDPETLEPSDDGLIEVEGMPTGFLRISRSAVEQLSTVYKGRSYKSHMAPGLDIPCLFDVGLDDEGDYRGEDFWFCKRWRDIGGKVWLDPHIKLGHIGTKEYKGDIGNWLRNSQRVDPLQAASNIMDLRRAIGSAA